MSRATCAEINLSALRHNLQVARKASQSKQMAIIKANAYGHGLVDVAHALYDADGFGVATIDEAIQLRESGIHQPIILLEGFNEASDLNLIYAYNLQPCIHNHHQIDLIVKEAKHTLSCWMKIDTGMHRLGFDITDAHIAYSRLQDCEFVQSPINLMTHLASADDVASDFTTTQLAEFHKALEVLADRDANTQISIANSAGILGWKDSHADWCRPGIMLFGCSPFISDTAHNQDLMPVMTIKSEVIAIHDFKKGDSIGYGQAYICANDMKVATIAIGYGDGYPRHAKTGTPVLINSQRAPVVGRVSMDMMTVDISSINRVELGDEVILWGEGLPAEEIAQCADTISYELFCHITSRVKLIYKE